MILFYNYGEDLGHLDDNGDLDEEDDQQFDYNEIGAVAGLG